MKKTSLLIATLCGLTWSMHGQIAHASTMLIPHPRSKQYLVMPNPYRLHVTQAMDIDVEKIRKAQA